MSMHIVGPYMTTTKYNSKSKKTKNKRLLAAQERHEKWMNDNGYNKKATAIVNEIPNYATNRPSVPLSNKICSNGAAKDRKEYTGTLIKGIATMHKSNAVPIINKTQAIEISEMRRN
jgi:hypothetical protein